MVTLADEQYKNITPLTNQSEYLLLGFDHSSNLIFIVLHK